MYSSLLRSTHHVLAALSRHTTHVPAVVSRRHTPWYSLSPLVPCHSFASKRRASSPSQPTAKPTPTPPPPLDGTGSIKRRSRKAEYEKRLQWRTRSDSSQTTYQLSGKNSAFGGTHNSARLFGPTQTAVQSNATQRTTLQPVMSYRKRFASAEFNGKLLQKVVTMGLGKNQKRLLRRAAHDVRHAVRGTPESSQSPSLKNTPAHMIAAARNRANRNQPALPSTPTIRMCLTKHISAVATMILTTMHMIR
jgi:hypothetical protein